MRPVSGTSAKVRFGLFALLVILVFEIDWAQGLDLVDQSFAAAYKFKPDADADDTALVVRNCVFNGPFTVTPNATGLKLYNVTFRGPRVTVGGFSPNRLPVSADRATIFYSPTVELYNTSLSGVFDLEESAWQVRVIDSTLLPDSNITVARSDNVRLIELTRCRIDRASVWIYNVTFPLYEGSKCGVVTVLDSTLRGASIIMEQTDSKDRHDGTRHLFQNTLVAHSLIAVRSSITAATAYWTGTFAFRFIDLSVYNATISFEDTILETTSHEAGYAMAVQTSAVLALDRDPEDTSGEPPLTYVWTLQFIGCLFRPQVGGQTFNFAAKQTEYGIGNYGLMRRLHFILRDTTITVRRYTAAVAVYGSDNVLESSLIEITRSTLLRRADFDHPDNRFVDFDIDRLASAATINCGGGSFIANSTTFTGTADSDIIIRGCSFRQGRELALRNVTFLSRTPNWPGTFQLINSTFTENASLIFTNVTALMHQAEGARLLVDSSTFNDASIGMFDCHIMVSAHTTSAWAMRVSNVEFVNSSRFVWLNNVIPGAVYNAGAYSCVLGFHNARIENSSICVTNLTVAFGPSALPYQYIGSSAPDGHSGWGLGLGRIDTVYVTGAATIVHSSLTLENVTTPGVTIRRTGNLPYGIGVFVPMINSTVNLRRVCTNYLNEIAHVDNSQLVVAVEDIVVASFQVNCGGGPISGFDLSGQFIDDVRLDHCQLVRGTIRLTNVSFGNRAVADSGNLHFVNCTFVRAAIVVRNLEARFRADQASRLHIVDCHFFAAAFTLTGSWITAFGHSSTSVGIHVVGTRFWQSTFIVNDTLLDTITHWDSGYGSYGSGTGILVERSLVEASNVSFVACTMRLHQDAARTRYFFVDEPDGVSGFNQGGSISGIRFDATTNFTAASRLLISSLRLEKGYEVNIAATFASSMCLIADHQASNDPDALSFSSVSNIDFQLGLSNVTAGALQVAGHQSLRVTLWQPNISTVTIRNASSAFACSVSQEGAASLVSTGAAMASCDVVSALTRCDNVSISGPRILQPRPFISLDGFSNSVVCEPTSPPRSGLPISDPLPDFHWPMQLVSRPPRTIGCYDPLPAATSTPSSSLRPTPTRSTTPQSTRTKSLTAQLTTSAPHEPTALGTLHPPPTTVAAPTAPPTPSFAPATDRPTPTASVKVTGHRGRTPTVTMDLGALAAGLVGRGARDTTTLSSAVIAAGAIAGGPLSGLLSAAATSRSSNTLRLVASIDCNYDEAEATDATFVEAFAPIPGIFAAPFSSGKASMLITSTLMWACVIIAVLCRRAKKLGPRRGRHVATLMLVFQAYYGINITVPAVTAILHLPLSAKLLGFFAVSTNTGVLLLWTIPLLVSSGDSLEAALLWHDNFATEKEEGTRASGDDTTTAHPAVWYLLSMFDAIRASLLAKAYGRVALAEEFWVASISAIITGYQPATGGCSGVAWAQLVLAGLHLAYMLVVRPYQSLLEMALALMNAAINVVIAALAVRIVALRSDGDADAAESPEAMLAQLVMVVFIMFIAQPFVLAISEGIHWRFGRGRHGRVKVAFCSAEKVLAPPAPSVGQSNGDALLVVPLVSATPAIPPAETGTSSASGAVPPRDISPPRNPLRRRESESGSPAVPRNGVPRVRTQDRS
jgi:hypothetical protein